MAPSRPPWTLPPPSSPRCPAEHYRAFHRLKYASSANCCCSRSYSTIHRAFAFSSQPAGWNAFACKQVKQELTCPELLPGSPEFGRLLTMLRSASGANQSATLRLETVE